MTARHKTATEHPSLSDRPVPHSDSWLLRAAQRAATRLLTPPGPSPRGGLA